jgi:hypothetical protein
MLKNGYQRFLLNLRQFPTKCVENLGLMIAKLI